MLRHRYILALFVLLAALPFTVDYFSTLPWSYFLLITILFLSIESYGAYFIHSNFHLRTICSAPTSEKKVALTFDDGPNSETSGILDVLKEYNAKATFFCIGNKIVGHEALLKRIDAEGHLIGNHSYTHASLFDLKRPSGFVKELKDTSESIQKVIDKTPHYFRPPYGVTTPALARALKKLNYAVIGWNIRSFDTTIKNKKRVLERIKTRLRPGSIILMHDTIPGNAALVKDVLLYLKEKNYTVVPLDSLIQIKAYV